MSPYFSGIFLTIMLLSVVFYRHGQLAIQAIKDSDYRPLIHRHCRDPSIILVKAGIFICDSVNLTYKLAFSSICVYAIPFTVGTMLVAILIGRNEGLIFSVFSSFVVSFFVSG